MQYFQKIPQEPGEAKEGKEDHEGKENKCKVITHTHIHSPYIPKIGKCSSPYTTLRRDLRN